MMLVMLILQTETHRLEGSGKKRACIYLLWTEIKSVLEGLFCFVLGCFCVWFFFFIEQSVREIKREDEWQRLAEKQQKQTNAEMYF